MTGLAVPQPPIPVTLLTGFLGSGKTTVLRHLLNQPEMGETAVIVNEFGDVGLDHLLLERGDESTLLLDSGCLCCTLKSDLVITLQSMLERRERGDVPAFERVVIETTGLADPGALIRTFWSDPLRLSRYGFDRTVTCVDAVAGPRTLTQHREARRQVALADDLIVTKIDMELPDRSLAAISDINPNAQVVTVTNGELPASVITAPGSTTSPAIADDMVYDIEGHLLGVTSVSVQGRRAIPWTHVERVLAAMVERYGERLLRLKGLIAIEGVAGLVRVDAVQGVFHRPVEMAMSKTGNKESRVVAIAENVDATVLRQDLEALLDLLAEDLPRSA